MSEAQPPSDRTPRNDIESTALEHDVVEHLTGRDHVARCRGCGAETLWCDREHLTHRDGCEVA